MQILAGIILLGVLITFHELGHFLFAKWLGVRVLVFSIGFGPKLFGFKKGDTEYRISAIPLGGYVRMFGESYETELTQEEKRRSFIHQPIWRKSLIAFAGPLFNFILPVILLFFLLVGKEQVFAPKVGTVLKGGAAEKAGIVPDDLILSIDDHPIKSFSAAAEMIAGHPNVDLKLQIKRVDVKGHVSLMDVMVKPQAKPSANPLAKDELVGRIGIMPAIEKPIVMVMKNSPLKRAGVVDFDEISEIDGQKIESFSSLRMALSGLRPGQKLLLRRGLASEQETKDIVIAVPGDLSREIRPQSIEVAGSIEQDLDSEDQEKLKETAQILKAAQAQLVKDHGLMGAKGCVTEIRDDGMAYKEGLRLKDCLVAVDGEMLATTYQLQQAFMPDFNKPHLVGVISPDGSGKILKLSLPPDAMDHMGLDADVLSMLGLATAQVFKAGDLIELDVGPYEAIKRAFNKTLDLGVMTAKSVAMLITREAPASQIGGPIMLFDVAQQAAEKGLAFYVFVMCLLSVNLGLLNLIPIPALDGGHLLMFGIEAIRGRPLSEKTRALLTQIGIAILLFIMAFAIFNDLSRIFR